MMRLTLLLFPLMLAACGSKVFKSERAVRVLDAAGDLADFDEIVVVERGMASSGSDEPRGGELRAKVDGDEREVPLPLQENRCRLRQPR